MLYYYSDVCCVLFSGGGYRTPGTVVLKGNVFNTSLCVFCSNRVHNQSVSSDPDPASHPLPPGPLCRLSGPAWCFVHSWTRRQAGAELLPSTLREGRHRADFNVMLMTSTTVNAVQCYYRTSVIYSTVHKFA